MTESPRPLEVKEDLQFLLQLYKGVGLIATCLRPIMVQELKEGEKQYKRWKKKTLTEVAPRRIAAAAAAASAVGRHWQEVAKGFSQSRDVSPILSPLFYPKLSFAHSSNRRLYFVEKKALLPDDKE